MEHGETQVCSRLDLRLEGFVPNWREGLLFCGGPVDVDLINIYENVWVYRVLDELPGEADIVTALEVRGPQLHRLNEFHF